MQTFLVDSADHGRGYLQAGDGRVSLRLPMRDDAAGPIYEVHVMSAQSALQLAEALIDAAWAAQTDEQHVD